MAETSLRERAEAKGAAARGGAKRPEKPVPLRRIAGILRPYYGRIVVAAILLIASNGLGLVFPLIIRSLLNTILVQRDERLLNTVVLVLFVAVTASIQPRFLNITNIQFILINTTVFALLAVFVIGILFVFHHWSVQPKG